MKKFLLTALVALAATFAGTVSSGFASALVFWPAHWWSEVIGEQISAGEQFLMAARRPLRRGRGSARHRATAAREGWFAEIRRPGTSYSGAAVGRIGDARSH